MWFSGDASTNPCGALRVWSRATADEGDGPKTFSPLRGQRPRQQQQTVDSNTLRAQASPTGCPPGDLPMLQWQSARKHESRSIQEIEGPPSILEDDTILGRGGEKVSSCPPHKAREAPYHMDHSKEPSSGGEDNRLRHCHSGQCLVRSKPTSQLVIPGVSRTLTSMARTIVALSLFSKLISSKRASNQTCSRAELYVISNEQFKPHGSRDPRAGLPRFCSVLFPTSSEPSSWGVLRSRLQIPFAQEAARRTSCASWFTGVSSESKNNEKSNTREKRQKRETRETPEKTTNTRNTSKTRNVRREN